MRVGKSAALAPVPPVALPPVAEPAEPPDPGLAPEAPPEPAEAPAPVPPTPDDAPLPLASGGELTFEQAAVSGRTMATRAARFVVLAIREDGTSRPRWVEQADLV
jgi:hypothetical protein